MLVDMDHPPLIEQQAGFLGEQPMGIRTAADGHDQLVDRLAVGARVVLVLDGHLVVLDLARYDPRAQADIQALRGELPQGLLGDLLIGDGQEAVLGLEQDHL